MRVCLSGSGSTFQPHKFVTRLTGNFYKTIEKYIELKKAKTNPKKKAKPNPNLN